jgi:hypothetical protein
MDKATYDLIMTYGQRGFWKNDNLDVEDFKILDKGCLMYIKGHPVPMRGNFAIESNHIVHGTKRASTLFAYFLIGKRYWNSNFKIGWLGRIMILIGAFQYWKLMFEWIARNFESIEMDKDRYCQPVREIYRLIKDEKIRLIICSILEFDDAYRYRVQDLFSILNKDLFEKNPIKELKRLWKICVVRESPNAGFTKFNFIFPFVMIYIKFNRKLFKEIKEFFMNIDLNEIKLSIEDIYWSNMKTQYNFRGMPYEFRKEENENIKKNYKAV